MEILLTGYTAFLTQEWIETAFPDDHVLTTHTKSEALLDTRVKTVTLDGKQLLAAMERRDTLAAALEELAEEQEHEHHHHDDDECGCGCHDHDHDHEHHHHHDEDDDECGCGCHEHDHHHHHHHADEVFTSWGKETAHPYEKQELAAALEALDTGDYGQVLRAKGIVAGTDGKWLHFDYVPGEVEIRNGAAGVTGRLCVIGAELKEDALTSLFHLN